MLKKKKWRKKRWTWKARREKDWVGKGEAEEEEEEDDGKKRTKRTTTTK